MQFSTLTGACLLVLSALTNNANAYAYGSLVSTTGSSTLIAYGAKPTTPVRPNQYSTSAYTTIHGSVKTIQTCTIEYCVLQPATVRTSVATVYGSSTVKATTTKTGTYYLTKKDQTRTITKTTTKPCTVTAKGDVHTVYSTRLVKVTSVRTVSTLKTVTSSLPAYTSAQSEVVVPTPSGFVYAGEDPANAESNFPTYDIKKRYAGGDGHYPKSVKCTKTLQTISTSTYTVISKTTSAVYGQTSTITYTKSITKTVYPQYAQTTTITRVATSTIVSTSTKTSYTTVTKQSTATAPATTSYAACGSANIFSGPTGSVGALIGNESIEVPNVSTPEECCAKCQAHVSGYGANDCAGSFFGISNDEPTCMLKLSETCDNSKNIGMFVPYPDADEFEGYVSNGPCGKWNLLTSVDYTSPPE